MATTGVDAAMLVFTGLSADEQNEMLTRAKTARALRESGGKTMTARWDPRKPSP